jgi:hypothetical protein
VKPEDVDAVYELAKFNFECGQYVQAGPLLRRFLELTSDPQKQLSALWGKIASDLAMSNWTEGILFVDRFSNLLSIGRFCQARSPDRSHRYTFEAIATSNLGCPLELVHIFPD